MKKVKNASLITFALSIAGKKQLKALNKASKNCKTTQEKTLRAILKYAKDTQWGKEHNFAQILQAQTPDTLFTLYQKNNPPTDYEDIRPYIEKCKNGAKDILFPGKPFMYATTSGTTSLPKWIPITNEYCQNIYKKMSRLWLYSFIMHRHKVFFGKCLSIVGKVIEGYAPDGTIYGSVSGLTRDDCPAFIRKIHSSDSIVFNIDDYKSRYYVLMRTAIEQNVTCLITANPSTVVEMQNNVNEFLDDYIKDIEEGSLKKDLLVPQEVRDFLQKEYKPNPKRAAELKALKQKYGTILPKHYWPDFQFMTTWKCGNTAVYLQKFKNSFPANTLHQEFGYFASECRFGLVMNGKDDTVPFAHFHYFEFIKASDIDNPAPQFLQLHQLEKGCRYCVYITTFAGLYRYKMNDIVECTGKYFDVPTIQFIQKTAGIISMTGEKLSEQQFISAAQMAQDKTGQKLKFYIGFADIQASLYHFYFEFADNNVTQQQADNFAKEVDTFLGQLNIEYKAKRDSLRIKDPIAHRLVENSFENYKQECLKQGARDGQFKLNLLLQDEKRHSAFKELVKK